MRTRCSPRVGTGDGSEFLTWSRSRPGARSTYDAYLQRNGGPVVKLNKRGVGYAGDVDVSEHLAVYQQVRNHDSRIMFYDWKAKTRYAAPEEVNTPEWEFAPRIQGDYLLFGRETWRNGSERYELLLFNRADGTVTSLDTIPYGYDYGVVDPGQMTGDWVVWRKAVENWAEQRVYRHNIATGVTDEVPSAAGRYDFGASVTADGTVYFVRSPGGCQSVRIRSFTARKVRARPSCTRCDRDTKSATRTPRGGPTARRTCCSTGSPATPPWRTGTSTGCWWGTGRRLRSPRFAARPPARASLLLRRQISGFTIESHAPSPVPATWPAQASWPPKGSEVEHRDALSRPPMSASASAMRVSGGWYLGR